MDREKYQVGVPFAGKYKERFNSDSTEYGGSHKPGVRAKTAREEEWDEREFSIRMTLPALSVVIYQCTPQPVKENKKRNKKENTKAGRK
jgi:1,4-alpha-glucan branching enzyme